MSNNSQVIIEDDNGEVILETGDDIIIVDENEQESHNNINSNDNATQSMQNEIKNENNNLMVNVQDTGSDIDRDLPMTPSLKLLKLHTTKYDDISDRSITKYINDIPYEIIVDTLIDQAISNNNIFKYFDNYALHDPSKTRIFIRSLNYDTTSESLKEAFKIFGNILDSTVIYDKVSNKSKGYGFITFETCLQAKKAVRASYLEVDGHRTQIALATPLRHANYEIPKTNAPKNQRRINQESRISHSRSRSRSPRVRNDYRRYSSSHSSRNSRNNQRNSRRRFR